MIPLQLISDQVARLYSAKPELSPEACENLLFTQRTLRGRLAQLASTG